MFDVMPQFIFQALCVLLRMNVGLYWILILCNQSGYLVRFSAIEIVMLLFLKL